MEYLMTSSIYDLSERAVIRYFRLKGMTPTEIYEGITSALREDAPSYNTVKKWAAE